MSTRSRRTTSAVGIVLLLASLLVALGLPAMANDQENGTQSAACGGEWHWVHNQTSATSGTLTATFQNAGTISVSNGAPFTANILHYYIYLPAGDTLLSASDNVNDDGKLVLSHWPTCQGSTTSTSQGSTTSTSQGSTTTGSTTTTSEGSTTTTSEGSTTTGSTTTTSEGSTTTGSTTTTSDGSTTTTSQATTTTGQQVTTTQQESSTTSSSVPFDSVPEVDTEVLGIQVSAPEAAQVATQETLPFTGISTGSMGLLAAAFAGVGLLLLLAARQNEEQTPARSWS
jgi:hypothetical protein